MAHRIHRGFTLIELMIVVAIIGILAAIAVPAYQDYIARSQISEAVSLLASAKTPFGEYYANEGRWPVLADDVMASTRGRYTSTITITQNAGAATGMVEVTANMNSAGINNQIVGKTVRLVSSDARSWSCLPGAVNGADPLYLPASCRN